MQEAGPGGFFPYSPSPSSIGSSASHALPHPRSSPLRPGGTKESSFVRYVDQQILHIQRRFAKRDSSLKTERGVREYDEEGRAIEEVIPAATTGKNKVDDWHDVSGYTTFADVARDVEELAGVIWVSGTPSLQVPYLINMALLTTSMLPAFPASPRQMFRLLSKLDYAFASLLQGRDIDNGEPLPGFGFGRRVSGTEKVRIKSLVERSRVIVVEVMSRGEFDEEDDDESNAAVAEEVEDGDLVLDDVDDYREDDTSWDMQVAKVYDRTLVELGDSMEGPSIGIRTQPGG